MTPHQLDSFRGRIQASVRAGELTEETVFGADGAEHKIYHGDLLWCGFELKEAECVLWFRE
jgi:hypothetical protein